MWTLHDRQKKSDPPLYEHLIIAYCNTIVEKKKIAFTESGKLISNGMSASKGL